MMSQNKGGKTKMEDKPIIHIVAIQCPPETDVKFNKWYNEIHIPMLLKFKGLKEVTRYKIIKKTEEYPRYLTIYKFESQNAYEAYETSPELAAALEETRETWKEKGYERKWREQYEVMKTWER